LLLPVPDTDSVDQISGFPLISAVTCGIMDTQTTA
jgi:hypothetical protein